ncbi:hypothetical protein MRX96_025961 [Rhipicephalus microplus]
MGFGAMMAGRVSMDTLEEWKASHHMGFVWNTSAKGTPLLGYPVLAGQNKDGESDELFTWIPWNSYSTPSQLCFDACSYEEPAKTYGSKTVPLMMGDDLTWTSAVEHYRDADNLLNHANRVGRWPMNILRWLINGAELRPVNVMYSTPACYLEALHSEKSRTWPRFQDDLLPYTDRAKHTWTGYYTTRPNLKMMARYANGFLQACKQLSVLGAHEQVTKEVFSTALSNLAMGTGLLPSRRGAKRPQVFGFCHRLNESHCPYSEEESQFTVILYNPASVDVSPYIRLPVDTSRSSNFTVKAPGGFEVQSQLVPLSRHPSSSDVEVLTNATSVLLFKARIKPLGFSVYKVVASGPQTTASSSKSFLELDRPASFIENKRYRIDLDPASGLVARVVLLAREKRGASSGSSDSTSVSLRQTFASYDQDQGDFSVPFPGHYVFSAHREAQALGNRVAYRVVKGPLVQEIQQIFNDYVSQSVILHKDSDFIEFRWTVGPPPAA